MSRMERNIKLKISRTEDHGTGDPWPHLVVERSRVKVTMSLKAVTENQPCLRDGKAYELQTWYPYGLRWPASPTRAVTATVTARARGNTKACAQWPPSCGRMLKSPLEGAGAYCGGRITARTAFYVVLWPRPLEWGRVTPYNHAPPPLSPPIAVFSK